MSAKSGKLPAAKPVELISLQEAAAHYHIHPDTIRRRIRLGELTGYKMGHKLLRVDLAELEALFKPIPTTKKRVG